MTDERIRKVLILGGGSSGWMAAAALSKTLGNSFCEIKLIESEQIGTVGVGEATIPQILSYNKLLGLDEDEFVRMTQATFKLGIQFTDWNRIGDKYLHAFGELGQNIQGVQFYHYWLKMQAKGKASGIDDYTFSSLACYNNKFMRPYDAGNSPLSKIAYAFHFDAGLYAKYLRDKSEKAGVIRVEGKAVKTHLREDGFIQSIQLENGDIHEADFFIDCSGFKGVLIEEALKTGYEDWSHWLPCDRAITVPTTNVEAPWPYTRAAAQKAGWQWRIPLQHRVGNGHVYCSKYMSNDEATSILLKNITGEPLSEPRQFRFTTGKRNKFWNKNCVALGLASGFMEPLESTSLHLVQSAIAKLLSFFPNKHFDEEDINEYNRQMHFEYERIRDFLILHYYATERNDSPFWDYCRTMDVPKELTQKIEQYKCNARIYRNTNEMFNDLSWFEVMNGQGIKPRSYHPMVDVLPEVEIESRMSDIKKVIHSTVDYMPTHQEFIDRYCKAGKPKS